MHLPRSRVRRLVVALAIAAPLTVQAAAQQTPTRAGAARAASALVATRSFTRLRSIRLDSAGVLRWADDGSEVALFGANYTLPSASDFRAAGYLHLDRKKLIDEDMEQFARMGWDALRISFWGDFENSDSAGNLVANEHLDLLDYMIARARERGIYMLLSATVTYDAGWPDSTQKRMTGFSKKYDKGQLGTLPAAIAAQQNYLRQVLNHVNPYTGIAYKDDPAIPFVELINEPWHHPEDLQGSIRYIDALTDAVRSTGSKQIIFHNLTQDVRIATAIRRSKAQGVTFGWYPSGLNSGHELQGNYLRAVDDYPPMRDSTIANLPRIVYEFDTPDLRTGYLYPAMARTFRAVGTQFAAMFAYDMLGTASRNLGWQTHYLNLVYTPRKALSAVIAAEAMKRLPRWKRYRGYPGNTRFGDFRVSYDENLGELAAPDAFLYDGDTRTAPPDPARLTRVAGYGSSPVVAYEGKGAYFLDKLGEGVWRLELYPDAVPVRDPYELPAADKIVTRAIWRAWPMTIRLPELGGGFRYEKIAGGSARGAATGATFTATPGVYVLRGPTANPRAPLPATVGRIGLREWHAPPRDTTPLTVIPDAPPTFTLGASVRVRARVVDTVAADSVTLAVRHVGAGWFRRVPMHRAAGYDYEGAIAADSLGEGPIEYAITVVRHDSATTFPSGEHRRAWAWNYDPVAQWHATIVRHDTPLRLFVPGEDVAHLAFSRIGDAGRTGLFRVPLSEETGEPVFHLELPHDGNWSPEDYTASLVVKDRVLARAADAPRARAVRVRLRGLSRRAAVRLTLMEKDGTSWSTTLDADSTWTTREIPLSSFELGRGVLLPEGFPGEWNYWVGPAQGRGGPTDSVRIADVERLQISVGRIRGLYDLPSDVRVEIADVTLLYEPEHAPH